MDLWKKQLVRSLFHYSSPRLNIEKAFMVKHPHVPKRLYKYRSFSNPLHFDALRRNRGWMAAPSYFNDPYDTVIHFDADRLLVEDRTADEFMKSFEFLKQGEVPKEDWRPMKLEAPVRQREWRRKVYSEIVRNGPKQVLEQIQSISDSVFSKVNIDLNRRMSQTLREGCSVMSLTEEPASVLMWSHYSDNHRGFCIEYDFDWLDYEDPRRRLCFPVFYRQKMTDATRYFAKKNMKEEFNALFGQFICLLKSDEWAYEKEWRIVYVIGPSHTNFELKMPKPSAVILGVNVTPENEAHMRDYCVATGVPLKQAVQRHDSFRLDIERADIGATDEARLAEKREVTSP